MSESVTYPPYEFIIPHYWAMYNLCHAQFYEMNYYPDKICILLAYNGSNPQQIIFVPLETFDNLTAILLSTCATGELNPQWNTILPLARFELATLTDIILGLRFRNLYYH